MIYVPRSAYGGRSHRYYPQPILRVHSRTRYFFELIHLYIFYMLILHIHTLARMYTQRLRLRVRSSYLSMGQWSPRFRRRLACRQIHTVAFHTQHGRNL